MVTLLVIFFPIIIFVGSRCAPENNTVRVAMCQIFCLDGDNPGNIVRIENALDEAKKAEADIACFPETVLLGWVNPEAHERSHPITIH
jgi:predicted amidohydrolase